MKQSFAKLTEDIQRTIIVYFEDQMDQVVRNKTELLTVNKISFKNLLLK